MEKCCKNHCTPVYYKRHRRCGFNPWVRKNPWKRKWQPTSQNYGFSNSHVQMWELDHKEGWALKNWCFWMVVLEKTLESPLDCEEIQPVHSKGNQSWVFIERTDAEAEAPILWPPDVKNWLIGRDPDAGQDWRWEEKEATEDEMVGWHRRLNGHEFEQTPGDSEGREGLACCGTQGLKESDMTEWLNHNNQYSCLQNATDRGVWWAIQSMKLPRVRYDWAN